MDDLIIFITTFFVIYNVDINGNRAFIPVKFKRYARKAVYNISSDE